MDRATTINNFCEYCMLFPAKIYHLAFLFGLCCSLALHVFVGEILWGWKGGETVLKFLVQEKQSLLHDALAKKTHHKKRKE